MQSKIPQINFGMDNNPGWDGVMSNTLHHGFYSGIKNEGDAKEFLSKAYADMREKCEKSDALAHGLTAIVLPGRKLMLATSGDAQAKMYAYEKKARSTFRMKVLNNSTNPSIGKDDFSEITGDEIDVTPEIVSFDLKEGELHDKRVFIELTAGTQKYDGHSVAIIDNADDLSEAAKNINEKAKAAKSSLCNLSTIIIEISTDSLEEGKYAMFSVFKGVNTFCTKTTDLAAQSLEDFAKRWELDMSIIDGFEKVSVNGLGIEEFEKNTIQGTTAIPTTMVESYTGLGIEDSGSLQIAGMVYSGSLSPTGSYTNSSEDLSGSASSRSK